jgi:hypothetical protein
LFFGRAGVGGGHGLSLARRWNGQDVFFPGGWCVCVVA